MLNLYKILFISLALNVTLGNIFYLTTGLTRVFGFPPSYIPGIVLLLFYTITNLRVTNRNMFLSGIALAIYSFISSFVRDVSIIKSLPYVLALPIYFIITSIAVNPILANETYPGNYCLIKDSKIWFVRLIKLLVIIMLSSVFLKLTLNSEDCNFLLSQNRNGTAFIICIYLYTILISVGRIFTVSRLSLNILILSSLIFSIHLTSRTSFIFIPISILLSSIFNPYMKSYYGSLLSKRLIITFCLFLSVIIFTNAGTFIIERVSSLPILFQALSNPSLITNSMPDFARITVVQQGILMFKNYFLFGVGLGRENFVNAARSIPEFQIIKGDYIRSHNFYISYLVDYGIIGFSIIIVFIQSIYKHLTSYQKIVLDSPKYNTIFILLGLLFLTNEYVLAPEVYFLFTLPIPILNALHYLQYEE